MPIVPSVTIQFVVSGGGMGDIIHMVPAFRYLFESYPHINGYVAVKSFMRDIYTHWLREFSPRITVTGNIYAEMNTLNVEYQMPGPMGYSLDRLAWGYIADRDIDDVPIEKRRLPLIKGNETDVEKFSLPENYAVICTGATAKTRHLPGETVDGLSEFFLANNITPVYLGKSEIHRNYRAEFYGDLTKGINLVDKTTTLEAACILAKSKVVVGVDGGLLHLAACSEVPILMALTIAGKRDFSKLRNPDSITKIIYPDLSCIFCQEKNRFVVRHDFNKACLKRDFSCVKSLTPDFFIPHLVEMI